MLLVVVVVVVTKDCVLVRYREKKAKAKAAKLVCLRLLRLCCLLFACLLNPLSMLGSSRRCAKKRSIWTKPMPAKSRLCRLAKCVCLLLVCRVSRAGSPRRWPARRQRVEAPPALPKLPDRVLNRANKALSQKMQAKVRVVVGCYSFSVAAEGNG